MNFVELPDANEFREWQGHPATVALRVFFTRRLDDLKNQWAAGAFTDQSQFGTAIANAKAIGSCETITLLLELDHEQLLGELCEK